MQQVLNPYSPIHKHIEARMNMVRKTAKQFYIEKRLAVQQVLNPYSPIHKHIEARMNMVRKTAKQFYIKKYSLSDVGIFLFSHHVAMALSSALQGLTSVFGMGTGGPPASSTPTVDSEYSFGSPNWARTSDIMINSHALYRLSYGGSYN